MLCLATDLNCHINHHLFDSWNFLEYAKEQGHHIFFFHSFVSLDVDCSFVFRFYLFIFFQDFGNDILDSLLQMIRIRFLIG